MFFFLLTRWQVLRGTLEGKVLLLASRIRIRAHDVTSLTGAPLTLPSVRL